MQDFKKLRVWHLARELSLDLIEALPERATRKVPGLRSQTIRSATSVGANIAEGCTRGTRNEFLHFLQIALGSLNEFEDHLLLARDARLVAKDVWTQLDSKTVLVRRMLICLIIAVQRRIDEDEAPRKEREASDSERP